MEKSELIKKLRTDLRQLEQILANWKGSEQETKLLKALAMRMLEDNFRLIFSSENKVQDMEPLPMFGIKPPHEMPDRPTHAASATSAPKKNTADPAPVSPQPEKTEKQTPVSDKNIPDLTPPPISAPGETPDSGKTETAQPEKTVAESQTEKSSEPETQPASKPETKEEPLPTSAVNASVLQSRENPKKEAGEKSTQFARILDAVAPPRLEDKLRNSKIEDLKKAIPLHEKFLYINELYQGEHGLYNSFIETINQCKSRQEADNQFNTEVKARSWDKESEIVVKLYSTIQRKFAE